VADLRENKFLYKDYKERRLSLQLLREASHQIIAENVHVSFYMYVYRNSSTRALLNQQS
jgi:hypothetical protein